MTNIPMVPAQTKTNCLLVRLFLFVFPDETWQTLSIGILLTTSTV